MASASRTFRSASIASEGSVGGGIAFSFSDMLGNHNLYAQVSADTYGGAWRLVKNTGVFLGYTNSRSAWNWGVAVEQTPYLAGGYATGSGKRQRQSRRFSIRRSFSVRSTAAISGMWPIRSVRPAASSSAAASRARRSRTEVRTTASSLRTGRVIWTTTITTSLADPLNMPSVSTAFVIDSSLFGATSPSPAAPVALRGLTDLRRSCTSRRRWSTTGATSCRRGSTRSPSAASTTAGTARLRGLRV